jgi:capsular polysaccharide transport system permease protein
MGVAATSNSGKLIIGARAQVRSIQALILRDLMLHYGRQNIGFLWVVLEPMLLTIGVTTILSHVHEPYERGTYMVSLILSGYMPLTLWRHTSNKGIHLLRGSLSVLYHRNITVFDVFLSRMILEGLGTTVALAVIYSFLWLARIVDTIQKPGHLMAAWLLLWLLGSGLALIIAALTEASEVAERFIQPFQYLLAPLSGIYFLVDWLPTWVQKYIVYNPLTNCVEFFRDGYFGDAITTHYDPWYTLSFAVILYWIGLALLAYSRKKMAPG